MSHVSTIRERHPRSKFCKGSPAHKARKVKLAEILARITAGRSFADLQGPIGVTSAD